MEQREVITKLIDDSVFEQLERLDKALEVAIAKMAKLNEATKDFSEIMEALEADGVKHKI